MLRPLFLAVVLLELFHTNAVADADSFTDSLGPRELAVGESMRAEAIGSLSTVLNPAGLALNRQLVFEGSYGFRNDDHASIANVSACDSTTPIAGCFYYHYMSAQPEVGGMQYKRRFHEGGLSAARVLSPQLVIGTNARFFDYNDQQDGDERGYSVDAGAIFRASQGVNIAAVGYNLVGTDSIQYPRGVATGVSLRPGAGSVGISLDALWNLDTDEGQGTGRYGGGVEYFARSGENGYPLRAGAVYDNASESGYLTLGLGFANAKMGLDIGGRKQLSGGDELVIQAGLRLIGPNVQQPH
jgi:hypothetical protein